MDEAVELSLSRAFEGWLELHLAERDEEAEALIAAQPPEVRDELDRMIEDYRLLIRGVASGTPLASGRRIGPYELRRELAHGATGTVWEAVDVELRRDVALKVLHPQLTLSPRTLERFRREARAAAEISHPGLVATLELVEEDGIHALVQELVGEGRTLADELDARRHLVSPPRRHAREMVTLLAQVAEAVGCLHEAGVVHRDLTPSNILLDEQGRPVVADLGVASLAEGQALTLTGAQLGTPLYMAPEQAAPQGEPVGPTADVFSLGVCLYEALALRRPFEGEGPLEAARAVARDEPPPLRVDSELQAVVMRALEKRPGRRYPDAAALAQDLRLWLGGRATGVRPPGPLVRTLRLVRRHRTAAALLGGATLLASLVLLVALREMRLRALSEERGERVTAALRVVGELAESLRPGADPGRARSPEQLIDELLRLTGEEGAGSLLLGSSPSSTHAEAGTSALASAGRLLLDRGRIEEAELLLGQVLERRRERHEPGGSTGPLVDALLDLAAVHELRWQHAEALPLLEEALDRLEGSGHAAGHTEELVRGHLGVAYYRLDQFAAAQALADEPGSADRHVEEARGGDLNAARLLVLDAQMELLQGRWGSATSWAGVAREEFERVLGQSHLWTLEALLIEASGLERANEFEQAGLLLDDLLIRARRQVGEDHPLFLWALKKKGEVLHNSWMLLTLGDVSPMADSEESEELFRRAAEGLTSAVGAESPMTLRARTAHCVALTRLGQFEEAEELGLGILAVKERVLGPDHESTLISLRSLCHIHSSARQYEQALVYSLQEVERRRRAGHQSRVAMWDAVAEVARIQIDLGRFDAARATLQELELLAPPQLPERNQAIPSLYRAQIHAHLGERELLEVELARISWRADHASLVLSLSAVLELALGAPLKASEHYETLASQATHPEGRAGLLVDQASALVAAGHLDRAGAILESAPVRGMEHGPSHLTSDIRRVREELKSARLAEEADGPR